MSGPVEQRTEPSEKMIKFALYLLAAKGIGRKDDLGDLAGWLHSMDHHQVWLLNKRLNAMPDRPLK